MIGSTATRAPTANVQSSPTSTMTPAISWPNSKGKAAIPRKVGEPSEAGANRWRSLPQTPPTLTSTRAHSPVGSAGSSMSTNEAGKSASARS